MSLATTHRRCGPGRCFWDTPPPWNVTAPLRHQHMWNRKRLIGYRGRYHNQALCPLPTGEAQTSVSSGKTEQSRAVKAWHGQRNMHLRLHLIRKRWASVRSTSRRNTSPTTTSAGFSCCKLRAKAAMLQLPAVAPADADPMVLLALFCGNPCLRCQPLVLASHGTANVDGDPALLSVLVDSALDEPHAMRAVACTVP